MFTKIYEKTKEYIKKEYKFLIILIAILFLFTIKLPYYIDMPGGIINISDRITIDNKKNLDGTLNFAYVSETRATIPTYIIAKINKNWDIIKKEEIVMKNETVKEMEFRDEINLKESVSNALYVGFKESGEEYEVINNKIYATYIYEEAKTNIKVGDQIIKIDNQIIKDKNDLKYVNSKNEGDQVTITVLNNKKEYTRTATLIELEGKVIIGVGINETFDIKSNHDIKINYNPRESGPSGGMMMSLTVYSYLTNIDLTNGKKIVGTGTIDKDGNVGSIGGVKYKLIGAVKNNADIFIVPNGKNYDEAIKIKQDKNYDIKIIGVSTLEETINELKQNN